MADFDSSLPVRTQAPGDVIVKIADATIPSQQLAVDSAGKVTVKLDDSAGNGLTSTLVSAKQALDVYNVNPLNIGTVDLSSFTYGTDLQQTIGGVFNDTGATVPSGDAAAARITAQRALHINIRDASGNELGATDAAGIWVRPGDGTNAQLFTAAGEATVSITQPLPAGSNTIGSVGVTNLPTTVDTNYGTVGASTIRGAAQIGNATGAADFNAGATGAQTLRVIANQGAANATPWNENIAQIAGSAPSAANSLPVQISTGGSFISATNPLPVIIDPAAAGTKINDYKDASAIAAGASDSHDYTVTAGKTLSLNQIIAAASGKAKMLVSVETGVASGIFTTVLVQFNSTAETNMVIQLSNPVSVAAGVRVRVIMSNRDLLAQDLYSTICGFEI